MIENFKVGGLTNSASIRRRSIALNPRLVYCSITGFGQTGPTRSGPATTSSSRAWAGCMDITGDPDGEPQKVGVAVVDLFTGLYAVIAIRRR